MVSKTPTNTKKCPEKGIFLVLYTIQTPDRQYAI